MADFEVMPIGTRAALAEAAELAREMEAIHIRRRDRAIERGHVAHSHILKASRHGDMAAKIERILG